MNAGIFDIFVDQNSHFYSEFEYVDSDNDPIAFTKNIKFHVRRSSIKTENLFSIYSDGFLDSNDKFFEETDYFPGTLTISNNIITLNIETSVMQKLYPGQYFYYIIIYDETEEKTFLKGRFTTETP